MDKYYVGAYWLGRRESAEQCAQRAELFFQLLTSCDPVFAHWFETGWTLEEALEKRLETRAATFLTEFLQQAQTEERLTDEGFSLHLWNGEDNEAGSGLSIYCGEASHFVPNNCVLKPPKAGMAFERVLQVPALTQILRAMVLAWEPEWGVATSQEHRSKLRAPSDTRLFVGWLTYFSHRRGPLPPLPAPVRVEPVEDKGSLVILTPERLSAENPAHLQLARDVSTLLSASGLLDPLRPFDP